MRELSSTWQRNKNFLQEKKYLIKHHLIEQKLQIYRNHWLTTCDHLLWPIQSFMSQDLVPFFNQEHLKMKFFHYHLLPLLPWSSQALQNRLSLAKFFFYLPFIFKPNLNLYLMRFFHLLYSEFILNFDHTNLLLIFQFHLLQFFTNHMNLLLIFQFHLLLV